MAAQILQHTSMKNNAPKRDTEQEFLKFVWPWNIIIFSQLTIF